MSAVLNVRLWVVVSVMLPLGLCAQRINHAGRILGPEPVVTSATLFNTPEADEIVSRMQILPVDNAWNEDISRRPLLPNSAAIVSQIVADLQSSRRNVRAFYEMNFVLVPASQPLIPITFDLYGDESDPSPYPIPSQLPIETWPIATPGTYSLYDWQRDLYQDGGDRHAIIVQPSSGNVWETWQTQLVLANSQTNWHAANGAKFNLNTNALRPAGWTSADAAGLSMFAGLVRYDECQRGEIEHALRVVVARSRKSYLYPATHYASSDTSTNRPAMGQRLRLQSSFVIPSTWSKEEKAVLTALKKYGAIVADNGGFFSLSVAPDDRWSNSAFSHLTSVSVTNFEVVLATGPTEGPRSPGAPRVDLGPDFAVLNNSAATLNAQIFYTNAAPLTYQWKLYSGPAAVTFSASNQSSTTVTFPALGEYIVMFSAENGIHAVAYDAVTISVGAGEKPAAPTNLRVVTSE